MINVFGSWILLRILSKLDPFLNKVHIYLKFYTASEGFMDTLKLVHRPQIKKGVRPVGDSFTLALGPFIFEVLRAHQVSVVKRREMGQLKTELGKARRSRSHP